MAENYAARILAAREKAGLGQRRFARIIGVQRSAIGHWEHERRRPHARYQEKLESILRKIEDGATGSA